MKTIIFFIVSCIPTLAHTMDISSNIMQTEFEDTVMHLDFIDDLYNGQYYESLLDYARRFIDHPEHSSFVDVILNRLEKSEDHEAVRSAWQKKRKSLLDRAVNRRVQASANSQVVGDARKQISLTNISSTQLYIHGLKVYHRAVVHETLLLTFSTKLARRDSEFNLQLNYPQSS